MQKWLIWECLQKRPEDRGEVRQGREEVKQTPYQPGRSLLCRRYRVWGLPSALYLADLGEGCNPKEWAGHQFPQGIGIGASEGLTAHHRCVGAAARNGCISGAGEQEAGKRPEVWTEHSLGASASGPGKPSCRPSPQASPQGTSSPASAHLRTFAHTAHGHSTNSLRGRP